MRYNTEKLRMPIVETLFLALGAILLLVLGAIMANGQTETQAVKVARRDAQVQQPLYMEYRGVRLGMTPAEARAKLASRR